MNKTRKRSIYSKNDFIAGDGMLTSVWGPSLWHYLHTMSFNYPNNPTVADKKHYKKFIISIQHVLPCKYCRDNLKSNLKKTPLKPSDLLNRDTFSRYVYNLHEMVNKMLGKKSALSFCQIRDRYEHFRARCTDEKPARFKKSHMVATRKIEKGCTEPLYGKKSQCIIKIVPQDAKNQTFQMDKKCIKGR